MASIAPVIAAGAIWAITRSPYVLMFAVLGPVIAIAGMLDNRISGRRSRRRQAREYNEEITDLATEIESRHQAERSARLTEAPTAREIVDDSARMTRWRATGSRRRSVAVGLGDRRSILALTGATDAQENADICRDASIVSDAPCAVDATRGIAVLGPAVLARAVCRGYLLQLCHAADPRGIRIVSLPESGWEWARTLPHTGQAGEAELTVRVVEDPTQQSPPADVTLALADAIEAAPAQCAEIITCETVTTAQWQSADDPAAVQQLTTHPVTSAAATGYAKRLSELAAETGVLSSSGTPPDAVAWADLTHRTDGAATQVPLGRGARGDAVVDLVEHGPHAVIGGTTGSGKSELLSAWSLGLAANHTPDELALLLVDFKGGATFAPLQALPHVVGVITDLDPLGATRALESLKAEVTYRERVLREHGVHDVAHVDGLGRLVIIVDEFATMLDGFPELHSLFVDIAARGRSLGMHLVLCTQRPTGVVKDSLLANCTLRLSLRVNNRTDSTAVIGVDTAASLPIDPPGRCVVVVPDQEPVTVQIGRVHPDDIAGVAREHAAALAPRRPWLDPLPMRIPFSEIPRSSDAFVLGMVDLPREQRQEVAEWRPDAQGSLLVLGSARAGKSTLVSCLEQQSTERWHVTRLSSDMERAFDTLEGCAEQAERSGAAAAGRGTVLVIDDLDALFSRLGDDQADHALSLVMRILRTGPRVGIWVVATAQRLARGMTGVAALFDSTMLMRLASRQEHILAGGNSASYSERRPAGGAVWSGDALQLAHVEQTLADDEGILVPALDLAATETLLVCCARPQQTASLLRERHSDAVVTMLTPGMPPASNDTGARQRILVADADTWQANWSLLAALRPTATLVVEACALSEYRSITRSRERPPYLHHRRGRAWRIATDGVITRCRL